MSNPFVIVGAGRHGRYVAETLEAVGPIAGFLDDTKAAGETVNGHPVLAGFGKMRDPTFVRDHIWFVAIGDNAPRSRVFRELADAGAEFVNVIHSTAFVSRTATLGRGVFVGNLTVINPNSGHRRLRGS